MSSFIWEKLRQRLIKSNWHQFKHLEKCRAALWKVIVKTHVDGGGGVTAGWKISGAQIKSDMKASPCGPPGARPAWLTPSVTQLRLLCCPAELRAVSSELQAACDGAEPAVGPHEPQADPNLPAVQQNQREARPGSGQQEGQRQRGRRRGSR